MSLYSEEELRKDAEEMGFSIKTHGRLYYLLDPEGELCVIGPKTKATLAEMHGFMNGVLHEFSRWGQDENELDEFSEVAGNA